VLGGDDPRGWLKHLTRLGPPRIPLHPANCRRPKVETRAGGNLSDLYLAEDGAEGLQAPHDVMHKIGKPVHRLGQAD